MRIAHLNNIAGVASRLADAQRRLGHEAVVITMGGRSKEFPSDVRLAEAEGPLGWNVAILRRARWLSDFDVLHVHGGLWRSQALLPLLSRAAGATLAVHFHGSDARTGKGVHYLNQAHVTFRSTNDLEALIPRSQWIPNPVSLPDLPGPVDHRRVVFGHFPSSPELKGTSAIEDLFRRAFGRAVEHRDAFLRLVSEDAELWVVSGLDHATAIETMADCDVVIDQISPFESYGMVAIEGMALGKPVMGTFRPEWYPGCPIVRLDPAQGVAALLAIADDPARRASLGKLGRAYVSEVHESGKVGRRVLRAYYGARAEVPLEATETASYWRTRGPRYVEERRFGTLQPKFRQQEEEIMEHLRAGGYRSVLEVGCGFGRISRRVIDEVGVPWIGLDISRGQLLRLRGQHPRAGSRVVEASSSSLPFGAGSADLVLAVEVLMHVHPSKIGDVAAELLRVARSAVVHVDWFEDYLVGFESGWNWVHDYPSIWRSLGAEVRQEPLRSSGIQSMFTIRSMAAVKAGRSVGPPPGAAGES